MMMVMVFNDDDDDAWVVLRAYSDRGVRRTPDPLPDLKLRFSIPYPRNVNVLSDAVLFGKTVSRNNDNAGSLLCSSSLC